LDSWLEVRPVPFDIDQVAPTLQRPFMSAYTICTSSMPTPIPGNFVIDKDLTVRLVDFDCIKRLDPVFVEHYRRLSRATALQQDDRHFEALIARGLLPSPMSIGNNQGGKST
jgi:predicted unusual protein kinase regulating ubiquinone biosynthesis (AarF/ABC1/UbiB family)